MKKNQNKSVKKNTAKNVQKSKVQTTIGTQQYINKETGEIEDFQVISKNITKDFNFHKIWIQDILNVLDSMGNKKILVLTFLLKIMRNEDNTFSGSYRDISKKCNVSLPTVSLVMQELLESNVIKKLTIGTYQFNPNIIIKGTSSKRQRLLIEYNMVDETIENAKNANIESPKSNQPKITQTTLEQQIAWANEEKLKDQVEAAKVDPTVKPVPTRKKQSQQIKEDIEVYGNANEEIAGFEVKESPEKIEAYNKAYAEFRNKVEKINKNLKSKSSKS